MEPVTPWSAELPLDDVVERLRDSPRVRAVGFLGSTGTDRWTPASDVDLLVVVDRLPAHHTVEATLVAGRLADIVLVDAGLVAGLRAHEPPAGAWPFVAWLAECRPAYDPDGLLADARRSATTLLAAHRVVDRDQVEITRAFLTHDWRVNTALLQRIDDPVVAMALGMRQLHTFVAAVQAWSVVRGAPSRGWKVDLARIRAEDPDTFALVSEWLGTSELTTRHRLFEAVLRRSLAPAGGLLPPGAVGAEASRTWTSLSGAAPPTR